MCSGPLTTADRFPRSAGSVQYRPLSSAARQENRKLVATEPEPTIHRAFPGLPRQKFQHPITLGMPRDH
jgi:hypothetical protein